MTRISGSRSTTGPLTTSRPSFNRGAGGGEDGPAESQATLERDASNVNGVAGLRKGAQGASGDMPWAPKAFSQGCVPAMFAAEWKAQNPAEFARVAADLRATGKAEINGVQLHLDHQSYLNDKGLGDNDEALVTGALLVSARAATGHVEGGGVNEAAVEWMKQVTKVNINLCEDPGSVSVGDYIAAGGEDSKHFMKVVGINGDNVVTRDAYGQDMLFTRAELASSMSCEQWDNLGGFTGWSPTAVSSSGRSRY